MGAVSYGRSCWKSEVSNQNGSIRPGHLRRPRLQPSRDGLHSYIMSGAFVDGGALSTRLANQQKNAVSVHSQLEYQVHAIGALAPFLPILLVVAAGVAFWGGILGRLL